ncbi:MAG TPA: DUF3017 domain-containing protein [Streptosporangiaceae bacterium]
MANRPAKTGSDRGLAGAPPPVVHHQGSPRRPGTPPGHRARAKDARDPRDPRDAGEPNAAASWLVTWLPYLIVLAGVALGLFITSQGSKHAGQGTSVVGAALLVAAVARLLLPSRYADLLSSRWKASDVVTFTALGAGVLIIALVLP